MTFYKIWSTQGYFERDTIEEAKAFVEQMEAEYRFLWQEFNNVYTGMSKHIQARIISQDDFDKLTAELHKKKFYELDYIQRHFPKSDLEDWIFCFEKSVHEALYPTAFFQYWEVYYPSTSPEYLLRKILRQLDHPLIQVTNYALDTDSVKH